MKSTKPNNIALIGMMGCGKTSTAKELAALVSKSHLVETDAIIEAQEKISICEIFETKGENYFRKCETQLIKSFMDKENLIISTGGGMFLLEENQTLLKENAYCIYLCATADTILERVKNDTKRPLLQCANPKERIEKLLEIRSTAYEKAHDKITTDGKTPKEIAIEILEKYKKYAS